MRDQIILDHIGFVKYIAKKMLRKMPPTVELDDLIQSGFLGLIDAIDKFDPKRDVSFLSYSSHRIKGSMLDYLRSMDYLSRNHREKVKAGTMSEITFVNLDSNDIQDDQNEPCDVVGKRMLRELLQTKIEDLNCRDQFIMYLYFYEGFSLLEVGDVLGLCESRISQFLSASIRELSINSTCSDL